MPVFIVGTTAELIKVAPVMRELASRGLRYQLWCTNQHVTGFDETLQDLELPPADVDLIPAHARSHVASTSQVPFWTGRVVWSVLRYRRALRRRVRFDGSPGRVLVHGDTFTTVLGALIGRLLGAEVAHVEAGLRSGSVRSPFPEELNRRLVGRIATTHYAPTSTEVSNLQRSHAPGRVVLTEANTVVDALRFAMHGQVGVDLPEHFGLVTLHRFELLRDPDAFSRIVSALAEYSSTHHLVMVAGQSERNRLEELGLMSLFDGDRFRVISKKRYAEFLPILTRADFVVTDSGGLQEECAAIGVPCAVHRLRTERQQGVGENVVLTKLSIPVLQEFLANWRTYRRPSVLDELHPSRIIVEDLQMRG